MSEDQESKTKAFAQRGRFLSTPTSSTSETKESHDSRLGVDVSDIYKKLPMMERILRPNEKTEFQEIIERKISIEVLRRISQKPNSAKEQEMDKGQKGIEDSWKYLKEIKEKEKHIENLQKRLEQEQRAGQEKVNEIRQARNQYNELKSKYDQVTTVNSRYSQANENVMKRLEERLELVNKLVISVSSRVREYLGQAESAGLLGTGSTGLSTFRENFETLMRRVQELETIKVKHDEMARERENMMAFFGVDSSTSLWSAFRDHMVKVDDQIDRQRKEIVGLSFKLKAKKMVLKKHLEAAAQAALAGPSLGVPAVTGTVSPGADTVMEALQQEMSGLQETKEKLERINNLLNNKVAQKEEKIEDLLKQLEDTKAALDHSKSEIEMVKLRHSLQLDKAPVDVDGALSVPENSSRPPSREPKDLNEKPVIPPIAKTEKESEKPTTEKQVDRKTSVKSNFSTQSLDRRPNRPPRVSQMSQPERTRHTSIFDPSLTITSVGPK